MRTSPLLRTIDAVTIPVPDLDDGLRFYRDALGHRLLWRNDAIEQVGLALPDGTAEIVLTTRLGYAPSWLVDSAAEAAEAVVAAGGRVVTEPFDIPVGTVVVVADPFGNVLVLLDLSTGRYTTDDAGAVTGVTREGAPSAMDTLEPARAAGTSEGAVPVRPGSRAHPSRRPPATSAPPASPAPWRGGRVRSGPGCTRPPAVTMPTRAPATCCCRRCSPAPG